MDYLVLVTRSRLPRHKHPHRNQREIERSVRGVCRKPSRESSHRVMDDATPPGDTPMESSSTFYHFNLHSCVCVFFYARKHFNFNITSCLRLYGVSLVCGFLQYRLRYCVYLKRRWFILHRALIPNPPSASAFCSLAGAVERIDRWDAEEVKEVIV